MIGYAAQNARIPRGLGPSALRLVALVAIVVYFAATVPAFRTGALTATLDGYALLGLVALGLGVTMIAGELDLSVASVAACGGILAVQLAPHIGVWPAVVAVAVGAALFGFFQGWLIASLGINSLVLTIGTLIALRGLAYIATDGTAVLLPDFSITDVLLWRLGPLSVGVAIATLVFAAIALFLAYTRYGREIYAVGGGRREAISSGVPIRRTLAVSFAISASCAGLAGALSSLRGGSGSPEAFPDLLLSAAAAALVGGISIYGGRGTVWSIILGVAIITTVQVGLVAQRAQSYEAQAVIGALLLIIVGVELASTKLSSRRRRPLSDTAEAATQTELTPSHIREEMTQ